MIQAGWADVPHLDEATKAELAASFPLHERAARMNGEPVLGSGKVFPVQEESIVIPPIPVPKHWARIIGLDFGWDHPAAAVWLAYDRDTDTVYLIDEFKIREASPVQQAPLLGGKGRWIPIAWPHDGLQHDKGSGEQLAEIYRKHGANLLPDRATFEDGSNGLEAGIAEMLDRMQTGRWRVFSTCTGWLDEFRLYHRKNGLIVKLKDDAISASRYGMMMIRFAITEPSKTAGFRPAVNRVGRRGGY